MPHIPAHPRHVVLVNPTRYLGNLLIAGGLIQAYAQHCAAHDCRLTLVVDAQFADLLQGSVPGAALLPYPRAALKRGSWWNKFSTYSGFLRKLRALDADLAFNIEEDSTSDRLTRWSGARYRLGCSTSRHVRGYERVVPVSFADRPAQRRHRWFSFMEVFATLDLPEATPGYLRFAAGALPSPPLEALIRQGFDPAKPYAVIHAGATKDYKKWPATHFAHVAASLREHGLQVVFIGAGRDAQETAAVLAALDDRRTMVDATNRFSLAQLAGFLQHARCMVGNDSGPFHLAAALGVRGVVIFGPTDVGLWRPLGEGVRVLQNSSVCSPECSRRQCLYDHACLKLISPEHALAALHELSVC